MKAIRDYRKNSAIASERRVTLAFKRFTFALARPFIDICHLSNFKTLVAYGILNMMYIEKQMNSM